MPSDNLVLNNSFEDDGSGFTTLFAPVTGWTFSLPITSMNAGETTFFDPVLAFHTYLAIGTVGTLGYVTQVIPTVPRSEISVQLRIHERWGRGQRVPGSLE